MGDKKKMIKSIFRKSIYGVMSLVLIGNIFWLSGCSANNENEASQAQKSSSSEGLWDQSYDKEIQELIQDFSKSMTKEDDLQQYFAIDEIVNGYNVDYASERTGLPVGELKVPTTESRTNEVLEEIEKIPYGLSFSYDQNNEIIQDQDAVDYTKLKLVRVDSPGPKMYNSEANQNNLQKQAKTYGAETFFNRLALYEMNGHYYIFPFTLMKYDNGIKLFDLSVTASDIYMVGPLLDENEYLEIIKDNEAWANK